MFDDAAVAVDRDQRSTAVGVFVVALFYLCVFGWLLLFVAVPALGLDMTPVVITSGSMSPGIRAGDVVLLTHAENPETLAPGTVIAFNDPARAGALITHRITGTTEAGDYRTRGDANADVDSTPVPPGDVVGVARLLVPVIGHPVVWVDRATGLFVVWAAVTLAACVLASRPPRGQVPDDVIQDNAA